MKKLTGPLTKAKIKQLRAGQVLSYDGILYTARDQAHKRMAAMINKKQELPFILKNQVIYYCGPNPALPGRVIGACGPTTSSRMDRFTPILLKAGLLGMVGKGERSKEVLSAIKKHKAVYFITHAGCGALISEYVKSKKFVGFGDLGPEAVFAFSVQDFPLMVAIDSEGDSIYD